MSDHVKRVLALLFCAGNSLLGFLFCLAGLITFDEDILLMIGLGAAFLVNGGLMWMYAETLKQNIRYHEILEEENRRLRLQQEEEDLSGILSGRSQYTEKETYRR